MSSQQLKGLLGRLLPAGTAGTLRNLSDPEVTEILSEITKLSDEEKSKLISVICVAHLMVYLRKRIWDEEFFRIILQFLEFKFIPNIHELAVKMGTRQSHQVQKELKTGASQIQEMIFRWKDEHEKETRFRLWILNKKLAHENFVEKSLLKMITDFSG